MAFELRKWARYSWNPICCRGTKLPVNLLLIAKLIVISLVLSHEWKHFKAPFLPFIPIFDIARSWEFFPFVLSSCFFIGAFLVFFNRSVRTGCMMVGLTLIIAILAVRSEYRNHSVFASFILILIGLHDKKHGFLLLRLQVAIVYFGAGLNKILDPDWLNGVFFEFWTHERLKHTPYMFISSFFPPLLFSQWFSKITIFLEFSIAIGFLIPRLYSLSIWLGIFLHGSIMIFTVDSANLKGMFQYFFPVAVSSYLVFFKWPDTNVIMQYDPGHPLILRMKKFSKRIDWDQIFHWEPFLKPLNEELNHPYFRLKTNDKTYVNFQAVKIFLLLNPLTYIATISCYLLLFKVVPFLANIIWGSHFIPFGASIKVLYVLVPIIFFFPLFESLFDLVIKKWDRKIVSKTVDL